MRRRLKPYQRQDDERVHGQGWKQRERNHRGAQPQPVRRGRHSRVNAKHPGSRKLRRHRKRRSQADDDPVANHHRNPEHDRSRHEQRLEPAAPRRCRDADNGDGDRPGDRNRHLLGFAARERGEDEVRHGARRTIAASEHAGQGTAKPGARRYARRWRERRAHLFPVTRKRHGDRASHR